MIKIGAAGFLEPSGADYWAGFLPASAWADCLRDAHDSMVYVEIELPEGAGDRPPSPTHIAACAWFAQHEEQMHTPVLAAILANYSRLQARYQYEPEEAATLMPPVATIADVLPLIDLRSLYIHDIVNGNLPYIGFTFGCTWDAEHGLGVLMHGLRAVAVGDGDVAFAATGPREDMKSHLA